MTITPSVCVALNSLPCLTPDCSFGAPQLSPTPSHTASLWSISQGVFSSSAHLAVASHGQGVMPEVLEADRPQMEEGVSLQMYLSVSDLADVSSLYRHLIFLLSKHSSCSPLLLIYHILKAL